MPKENRSSNTEMVSVPEGFMLVERSIWTEQQVEAATACITRLKGVPGMRDCDLAMAAIDAAQCKAPDIALSDLLPAPQPHPEPIAWMVGTAFWWTKEEAERDAAETGKTITPIGPMSGIAPAEEHQGEPVALPAMKNANSGHDTEDSYGDGWDDCLREIAKLGPLYKRPVQGEPVAWQVNWPNGTRELYTHEVGAKASMMPYQPLYLHADPGEVERLTEQLEVANQTIAYAARQAEEKQRSPTP
ncbi:hypothetical protein [Pseudomonas asiatica]|uniref:hypothetical protein n=1 Tax=Pseudomonas asiatica TaxID=2219225 RepID=UPI00207B6F3C|nr:hypothetical protein [Pseudomonas asiatica]